MWQNMTKCVQNHFEILHFEESFYLNIFQNPRIIVVVQFGTKIGWSWVTSQGKEVNSALSQQHGLKVSQ